MTEQTRVISKCETQLLHAFAMFLSSPILRESVILHPKKAPESPAMNSPEILELFNQRNLRLATNALFCGMGIHLPVALEGALKLKVRLEIREVAATD